MLYTAFEVTGAAVSGIRAALDAKGIKDVNVIGWAGDGGTMDIGIQALSGMAERNNNCLYICYDNEAYMNTGIQRSSSTPLGAWTTTTPVGKTQAWEQTPKKPMVEIMAAHRMPYVAQASIGYPEDFVAKVKKALSIPGAKYIQVLASCPTGWRSKPEEMIELAKMAVSSRAYNLYEVEGGIYHITHKPKKTSLEDYMRRQGRFSHLTTDFIAALDKQLDADWELLLKKEKMTNEK
jgi:2-oxoisovalerate ferredoxin oxidoreductase beta subunit